MLSYLPRRDTNIVFCVFLRLIGLRKDFYFFPKSRFPFRQKENAWLFYY